MHYVTILENLRQAEASGADAATARAAAREAVPTLFPPAPTMAEIDKVRASQDWKGFVDEARHIFATAYFTAPRVHKVDGESMTTDMRQYSVNLWSASKKEAATFSPAEAAIRKAAQDYVRVSIKQNITDQIPEAIDAPIEEEAEKLPDPTDVLAYVTDALTILSEKEPKAALALLNGLDSLVKSARPFISTGNPLPRKA